MQYVLCIFGTILWNSVDNNVQIVCKVFAILGREWLPALVNVIFILGESTDDSEGGEVNAKTDLQLVVYVPAAQPYFGSGAQEQHVVVESPPTPPESATYRCRLGFHLIKANFKVMLTPIP